MNSINNKLLQCYLKKWDAFKNDLEKQEKFKKDQPHLLAVTDEFEQQWNNSSLKMMFFGISPNGWKINDTLYSLAPRQSVEQLMELYKEFYFGGRNWRYGQTFWNYFYAIEELLKYRLNNHNIKVIWNNVNKVHEHFFETEQALFNVMSEEIQIFQPDVILVFGTGMRHKFHHKLSTVPCDDDFVKYEEWDEEEFLYYDVDPTIYPEINQFVKKIFITYHANARGNSGIKMKLVIDRLVEELRNI
jgi:hypothetical protein